MATAKNDLKLNREMVQTATIAALNNTAKVAYQEGADELLRIYNIRAGDLRRATHMRLARAGREQVDVVLRGERLELFKFSPKIITVRKSKKGRPILGVSVKVRRDSNRKKVKSGFVAIMESGKTSIYKRDPAWEHRYPFNIPEESFENFGARGRGLEKYLRKRRKKTLKVKGPKHGLPIHMLTTKDVPDMFQTRAEDRFFSVARELGSLFRNNLFRKLGGS